MSLPGVGERLVEVRERVGRAAAVVDRDPSAITLIGAAKRQPVDVIRQAVDAGLTHIGENQVQEARDKRPLLPGGITWHLIGPLQSNKVNPALELFDVVQSVDRLKIARRLQQRASQLGRTLPVFIEVNLGEEETKHGFLPRELADLTELLPEWDHLEIQGLMAIPPLGDDAEASRPWFRSLRELRDDFFSRPQLAGAPGLLSMGMSGDFEVAIQEGATHVRVGTALFGARA